MAKGDELITKNPNVSGKKAQKKRQCLLLEGPGVRHGDQPQHELLVSSSPTTPSLHPAVHAPGWI